MIAELFDGTRLEFPDDTAPEVVQSTVKRLTVERRTQQKPIDVNPANSTGTLNVAGLDTGVELGQTPTRALAGAGKGMSDLKLGAEQVLPNAASKLPPVLRMPAEIGMRISQGLGLMRNPSEAQAEADRRNTADKPLMDTRAGFWGNVGSNVAMTAPLSGVAALNTLRTAPVVGAGLGLFQPTTSQEGDSGRLMNAVLGAAGAWLGTAASRGAARVIAPQTRAPVRTLMNEGVTPTPGQILGGAAQVLEDKATSLPIVGDAITAARRRGVESLNRAVYNRATAPIGARVDAPVGREGVEGVRDALGQAYRDLLPRVTFQTDPAFDAAISNVRAMASTLPPQHAQQLERILQQQLFDRMTPSGRMSGETMKQVESELGRLVRGYSGDSSFDARQLGNALREVQDQIRQVLERTNPQAAQELARINSGYSLFARIRDAASRAGSKDGVITPAQLSAAVRAGDRTVGKGGFATGNAPMQDLSDAALNVLGPKYPDSGSIGRLFLGMGAAGGGALLEPTTLAGAAAGAAAYAPMGQRILAAVLAQRPEWAPRLADLVRRSASVTGPAAAALPNLAQ